MAGDFQGGEGGTILLELRESPQLIFVALIFVTAILSMSMALHKINVPIYHVYASETQTKKIT